MTTTVNGITHTTTKGTLVFDKLYKAEYQKPGFLTVQLRQAVTTVSLYPSQKIETSMNQSICDEQEFDIAPNIYESKENRVAWVNVPSISKVTKAAYSEAEAKAAIAKYPNGTIYRVLSNAPILDENQEWSIGQGLRTMSDFANSQVVRFSDNERNQALGQVGKINLDKNKNVQYRRTFFARENQPDVDVRTTDTSKHFVSPTITAELLGASIMEGQTI